LASWAGPSGKEENEETAGSGFVAVSVIHGLSGFPAEDGKLSEAQRTAIPAGPTPLVATVTVESFDNAPPEPTRYCETVASA